MAPTTLIQYGASGVCNTPACIALSETLLSNVNLNVDPCSDFFQFTCGNWLNTDPVKERTVEYHIPEQTQTQSRQNIISILNGTFEDLSKIIKTNDASYHTQDEADIDKKNFELVKNYYDLCLDNEARAELGATPIFQYVANIENTLLPNNAAEGNRPEHLARALAATTLQSIPIILDAQVNLNTFDLDYNMAYLKLLGLDRTVTYTSIDSLNRYRTSLRGYVNYVLGGPSSEDSAYGKLVYEESRRQNFTLWSSSKIDLAISRYIDFEIQLHTLQNLIPSENLGETGFPTFNELKNISTSIDWDTFFSTLVSPDYIHSSDFQINVSRNRILALDKLLAQTPVETLQEYFVIQTVRQLYSSLRFPSASPVGSPHNTTAAGIPQYNFRAPSSREPFTSTAEDVCAEETSKNFKEILGRFYTLSNFGASKEMKQAEDFVDNLHFTWLNDMLPETDWVSETTKLLLIEKIGALRKRVVHTTTSPDWRSPAALEKYYEDLKLESNYLEARHLFNISANLKIWDSLTQKRDANKWTAGNYPELFNALYSPNENLIEIPVGAFQEPLYDTEQPEYINYGGLGVNIGHELTHALGDIGIFYDKKGYFTMSLFTEDELNIYFDDKGQCFVDQFDKFVLTGPNDVLLPLNGTKTFGENLADAGGIRIAFNAYKNLIQKKRGGAPEQTLSGFEKYTPEQMFFISYGQFTCSTTQKSLAQDTIDNDTHAPFYFRNIGALQNSHEFAEAFNCPIGSPMNPEKKCSLW